MRSILTDFKLWSSLFLIFFFISCNQTPPLTKSLEGFALGTSYHIQYLGESSEEEIQQGIDSLFYILNKSLSTYLPQSDISKINKGDTTVIVDQHFRRVFEKATEVWEATNGYFDPTVGALVNAYGFGPKTPINSVGVIKRDSLLQLTGWQKVKLEGDGTIRKESPDIFIDFNALAKGYIVDIIGNFLHDSGSLNYMVEIGGEVVVKGQSPKTQKAWKIAIDDPRQGLRRQFLQTLSLYNQALASSGNYRKYRIDSITGEIFVHSISPLTGSALKTKILSTSVKAQDCMTADAWATALMVMPFQKGKELVENNPDLEALWTLTEKDDFLLVTSKNW